MSDQVRDEITAWLNSTEAAALVAVDYFRRKLNAARTGSSSDPGEDVRQAITTLGLSVSLTRPLFPIMPDTSPPWFFDEVRDAAHRHIVTAVSAIHLLAEGDGIGGNDR